MSSRLDEDLVRSPQTRLAVWALLLGYIAVYIYAERSGSALGMAAQETLFGVLMAGFGIYLAAEYEPEDTMMAVAAGLFLFGGAVNALSALLGLVVTVPVLVPNAAYLMVMLGFLLWVGHWVRSLT